MKKSNGILHGSWNWAKSFLSYVKGMLFSEAASSGGQLAFRLGLDQLILSKRYWIDRQQEALASLSSQIRSETISADTLQAALSEISDKIGAKMCSPALMYNELKRLKCLASNTKLLVIIESTQIDILAAAYKDPSVTYANYLADINFLLQLNDFKFINSHAGRQWLGFYHALVSPELFDRGLAMINNYALEQLALLSKNSLESQSSMVGAFDLIGEFEKWRSEQRCLPRKPIDNRVWHRLSEMQQTSKLDRHNDRPDMPKVPAKGTTPSRFSLGSLKKALAIPFRLISRHSILGSGVIFAARAAVAMAGVETKDVTDMLYTADAGVMFREGGELLVQDVTADVLSRNLQDSEGCRSGIDFPSTDNSWALTFGVELFDTEGYGVAVKPDGAIVIVGRTRGFVSSDWDILLAEFSPAGGLNWAKRLGGVDIDTGYNIAALSDGSVIVSGYSHSLSSSDDVVFFRLHPNGDTFFNVAFLGSEADYGQDIATNKDQAMIVLAGTDVVGAGTGKLLVVQYSITGVFEWATSLAGDNSIVPQGMAVKEDNAVVVVGYTKSFGSENGGWDALLVQFDAVGNLDWAMTVGGPGDDLGFEVVAKPDGSILFAGSTSSYTFGITSGLFAACDENGQLLWAKNLGGANYDSITGLASRNNTDTVLVGYTTSYGAGSRDVLIAQVDDLGVLKWARTYGGANEDLGNSVAVMAGGDIVLLGHSSSFGHSGVSLELLLARLETENPVWQLPSDATFNPLVPNIGNISGLVQSKFVSPTIVSAPPDLVSWNTATEGAIGEEAIIYASTGPNVLLWPTLFDAYAMYHFSYTLPENRYRFLESQPAIQVEVVGADWLSFDSSSRTLSGTPVLRPYEAVEVRLIMESVFVLGVGRYSFEDIILHICVISPNFSDSFSYAQLGGDLDDRASSVAAKDDGSFAVVGQTQSFGEGLIDGLVAYFAPSGSLQWVKTIGGSRNDAAFDVCFTSEGKIAVIGQTGSEGAGSNDVFVAQLDAGGNVDWIKTYGGINNDLGQKIELKSDGSMILFGHTLSFGASNNDFLLMQISALGDLVWAVALDGDEHGYSQDLRVKPDNTMLLCGATGDAAVPNLSAFIAHVDESGQLIRALAISGSERDFCNGVELTHSGGIQVVGATSAFGPGFTNGLIVQLDAGLNVQWSKAILSGRWVQMSSVVARPDGRLVLSGLSIGVGASSFDTFLMEQSADGDVNWIRVLGGDDADSGYGLALLADGSAVEVGDTKNFNALGTDVAILRFDRFGNLAIPGAQALQRTETSLFDVITVHPSVIDISSNFTLASVSPVVSNFTAVVNDVAPPVLSKVEYFSPNNLLPVTSVPFGQAYNLDLKTVLGPSVLLIGITQAGSGFLPNWLSYSFATQILSGTPSGSVRGIYELDMALLLAGREQQVNFILNVTNTVPKLTGPSAYNTTVGRFVFPLSNAFFDEEGDQIWPYGVAQVDGKLAPTIGSVDATTGRLFGTTLSGDQGSYLFNITADDPYDSGWQLITVNVLNTAPEQQFVFADPPPVTIGSQFTYSFPSNAFVDVDGDLISYSAESPEFLEFNPIGRTLTGIPAESDRGVSTTTIYANDPYGGRANISISIIVNADPIRQLSVDRFDTNRVGEPFSIPIPAGVFVDPDGDTVSYQLTEDIQHIKPSWLEFNPITSTMYGVPNSNTQQGYRLLFKVQDGRGGEAFYTPVLYVPNSPPQVVHPLPGITIPVDAAGAYPAPATVFFDPDDDAIDYALNRISGGSEEWLFLVNNVFTYLPRSGDQGAYYFDFIGFDSYGGSASVPFSITVFNRPPVLVYDIPQPGEASASVPWRFDIESDNFLDDDRDPLVYTATRLDGQSLPEWIDFSPTRRTFSGQASGRDRGQLAVKVLVDDTFGGQVEGFFNLTVVNSLPRPKERLFDQQASSTDNALVFTVTSFEDPDDEAITYRAVSNGQSSLPNWIEFDPATRTFTARPIRALPGNYLLTVIATDAVGGQRAESFNLAIQPPPSIDEDSTKDLIQLLVPFLTGVSLLGTVIATMAGRSRRIRMTDQAIQAWAEQKHHGITPVGQQSFEALRSALQEINRQLNSDTPLSEIEASLIEFGQMLQRYYAQKGVKLMPMTKLLNMRIVKTLTQYVTINILELQQAHINEGETLDAARLLHFFLGFVLAEHTGRKNRLTHDIKDKYLGPLDRLIARLPTRTRVDVSILHELESCREALVCMTDTNSLRVLCQTSFSHILSPGALVSDLKALIFNIPSTWYVTLLRLNQEAGQAATDIAALHRLQECAASEGNWRFRYGVIPILLSIITSTRSDEVRKQAIFGERKHLRLRRLGLLHLLRARQSRVLRWRNKWVSRHAAWSLNQLAGKLDPKAKRLLNDYLDPQAMARTPASRRVSSIATPLESRAVRVATAGAGAGSSLNGVSFISNPLRSGTRATGGRLKSWVGRHGAAPQRVRLAPVSETPEP